MIWLGYVYLVILILFGGSALLDDIKAGKTGRFAISLVPFLVFTITTIGFLFLPRPGELSWLVLTAMALGIALLIWDSVQDVKELARDDPDFGTGGAVFSVVLVAVVFAPAIVFGLLWARSRVPS
jgi:hypothetical protein